MKKFLLLSFFTFAFSVHAYDFSEADALFDARNGSLDGVAEARRMYKDAMHEVSCEELVHAVERFGALSLFEGGLVLPESEKTRRANIFENCRNVVEKISPDNLGKEHPAYYYWKSTCFGLWAQSANEMDALPLIGDFKRTLHAGIKLKDSKKYENGGIYRVAAAAYMASEKLALFGMYDLKLAYKLASAAVKLGPEHASAKVIKSKVLAKLGKNDDAKELLENVIDTLEEQVRTGSLDPKTGPEDVFVLKMAKEMLAEMN